MITIFLRVVASYNVTWVILTHSLQKQGMGWPLHTFTKKVVFDRGRNGAVLTAVQIVSVTLPPSMLSSGLRFGEYFMSSDTEMGS
ncbi:hypothetical protein CEXT_45491 [Caerostris extrusa]|uniref:Uncharacterized protein n=1 Tax=Caerostris extrusa TaxID=172846 RepID=A0AAV4UVK3_CAEEX|nr:hypothetical protein CEXT_45491 [Caerostris extrusa]